MTHRFAGATSFNQDLSAWPITYADFFDSMFEGASTFDQDLCAWTSTIEAEILPDMFAGTACPEQGDPEFISDFSQYSPLCYECPILTPQPSTSPSTTPSVSLAPSENPSELPSLLPSVAPSLLPSNPPSMAPTFKVFETYEELRNVLDGDCPFPPIECEQTFSE